jgi:hypothetical protein
MPITAIFWDPSNPSQQRMVRERVGPRWAGGTWNLHIGADAEELMVAEITHWSFAPPTPTPPGAQTHPYPMRSP